MHFSSMSCRALPPDIPVLPALPRLGAFLAPRRDSLHRTLFLCAFARVFLAFLASVLLVFATLLNAFFFCLFGFLSLAFLFLFFLCVLHFSRFALFALCIPRRGLFIFLSVIRALAPKKASPPLHGPHLSENSLGNGPLPRLPGQNSASSRDSPSLEGK